MTAAPADVEPPWPGPHESWPPVSDPPPAPSIAATSWRPADLAPALGDDWRPQQPTVGRRDDGRGILYPGKAHSIVGESEGGKSLLAQLICVQELNAGRTAVYLDFEDDGASVARRLLLLGASATAITGRFGYIAPTDAITAPGALRDLNAALGDLHPAVVILDGVTEALSLHGLSTLDNDEIAKFGRLVTRPITATGAAVASLDHVTKSTETRGRYAIGGVHKLNAINGAAFILENVHRFGDGLAGRSRLLIAKDRPGQLRRNALPGSSDRWWYADLTLDTSQPLPEPGELHAPFEHTEPFLPTVLMGRVSDALTGAPSALSGRDIEDRVTGKSPDIRRAVAALVDLGHIAVAPGARGARLHTLVKPYPEDLT